ncbi:hypothetical protein BDV93DRAFT_544910 [Ceratobasidium sp. AG-I]|nr:hypothetical protein BDV93DRAFT_544910 [Ceratobasidium sp. AG-I]
MSRASAKTTKPLPFIVAEYQGRKVAVRRSNNYEVTVAAVKKAFRTLRTTAPQDITICSRLEERGNDLVQITDKLWSELSPSLTHVTIVLGSVPPPARRPAHSAALPVAHVEGSSQAPGSSARKLNICVRTATGKGIHMKVSTSTPISRIQRALEELEGYSPGGYRLLYDGNKVCGTQTVGSLGMWDGDDLDISVQQCGGKPVIYLFPPQSQRDVHVRLSLVDSWNFSALYPPTSIKPGPTTSPRLAQSVSWTVDASPDGTLLDKGTNREVSYLFWEAHTVLDLLATPASSRPGSPSGPSDITFDPLRARLEPSNSALLPLDKATAYIDDTLLALGLHAEARTSFITYWLPSLQAHKFTALRFIPQNEYETAAPMSISPTPDVVTRVFMLFQGVNEVDLERWEPALVRATQNPSTWRDIVGVDMEKAADASLFRVLEWGGMEVK